MVLAFSICRFSLPSGPDRAGQSKAIGRGAEERPYIAQSPACADTDPQAFGCKQMSRQKWGFWLPGIVLRRERLRPDSRLHQITTHVRGMILSTTQIREGEGDFR
jgi:hypothetical protein